MSATQYYKIPMWSAVFFNIYYLLIFINHFVCIRPCAGRFIGSPLFNPYEVSFNQ